jgi:hypothetical protein
LLFRRLGIRSVMDVDEAVLIESCVCGGTTDFWTCVFFMNPDAVGAKEGDNDP